MIRGIIVYNKADAEYNEWFIEHLIEEGQAQGLFLELKIVDEAGFCEGSHVFSEASLIKELRDDNIQFAIVRNRSTRLCEELEELGIRCFNSSKVVKLGNDKWEMYREFSGSRIPVMYTQTSKLPYPFVMKPRSGHGGENVFLIKNAEEYEGVVSSLPEDRLQEFIYQMPASEKGRDIRVYVVGDTILTAMERTAADSNSDFRANFSLGGSAREHALTEDELKVAARVADYLKPDFIGIDLIYNNGKPVVNEIEDAVGTRMLYAHTDIDAVREYISWIKKSLLKGNE